VYTGVFGGCGVSVTWGSGWERLGGLVIRAWLGVADSFLSLEGGAVVVFVLERVIARMSLGLSSSQSSTVTTTV